MAQSKIARSLDDARSWAASFHKSERVESTIQCPHGIAVKIDVVEKGRESDSIMVCPDCWREAPDWVRVD